MSDVEQVRDGAVGSGSTNLQVSGGQSSGLTHSEPSTSQEESTEAEASRNQPVKPLESVDMTKTYKIRNYCVTICLDNQYCTR